MTGAVGINLPNYFNEILIASSQNVENYTIECTMIIPHIDLTNIHKYYDVGGKFYDKFYSYRVGANRESVILNSAFINDISVTANVTIKVYYR